MVCRYFVRTNIKIGMIFCLEVPYRSAESKAQKREMESLIAKIKNGFCVYLGDYTPDKKKLLKVSVQGGNEKWSFQGFLKVN